MKKILLTCLVTIAAYVITASAGERIYHAQAFYGLNGPVKEIIQNTDNPDAPQVDRFNSLTPRFEADGKLENASAKYNEAGYITECELPDNNDFKGRIHAEYDSEYRPVQYIIDISAPMAMQVTLTNEYDPAGQLVSTTSSIVTDEKLSAMIPAGGMPSSTMKYSDVEYDEYGNWTKRKVTISMNVDEEIKSMVTVHDIEQTEDRTIIYY